MTSTNVKVKLYLIYSCIFLLLSISISSCKHEELSDRPAEYPDTVKVFVYDTVHREVVIDDTISRRNQHDDYFSATIERLETEYTETKSKPVPDAFGPNIEVRVNKFSFNGDSDPRNEFVILQSLIDRNSDEGVSIHNLYYLDYFDGKYNIIDSICPSDFIFYLFDSSLFTGDLNDDGIDEIILDYRTYNTMGSDFFKSDIVSVSDGKLVVSNGVNSRLKIFNRKNGYYYIMEPIPDINEGRLGAHRFMVKKLVYSDNGFVAVDSLVSKNKYLFEEENELEIIGDAMNLRTINERRKVVTVDLLGINMISNDHVGNEWAFGFDVNGKSQGGNKVKSALYEEANLVIFSFAQESAEAYIDKSSATLIISNSDLANRGSFIIEDYVSVVESNGRYSGNVAEFKFVYRITVD